MSAHLAAKLTRLVSGTASEDYELREEVLQRFAREAYARGIACALIDENEPNRRVIAGTSLDRRVFGGDVHNEGHRILHPGSLAIRIKVDGNARPGASA